MSERGVTRPMALKGPHDSGGDGHAEPYSDQRYQMLGRHHRQTQWVYWSLIMLGVWMAAAPFTFGHLNEAIWVDPSGGRGVWFSEQAHTALRAQLTTWSDIVSGLLLIVLGWRTLKPNRPLSLWACCGVGMWLTFAPVAFWAPTAAAYLNDTFVGILVMALSILIPGMPNMPVFMIMGKAQPPGWSYNPSSWAQRWIMIATGFAGFIVSRYLGAFQLGYLDRVWDPFFGDSTRLVLNSDMSHMWPISDGAMGGLAYTFEFLMGFMGSPARWRTMPWMVTFFGVLVIPLGLVHIMLVISQPLVVGHWCTLCLLAAGIMLPMIPLEVDEVIAMGQHMVKAKKAGSRNGSLWQIFWKGGTAEDCQDDDRSPEIMSIADHPWRVFRASVWGMSFPWTLVAATAVGVAIMFVPWVFGAEKPASDAFHLCGALIVVVSVICMGEVVRVGRWLNVPLGLGVAIAPWLLSNGSAAAGIAGVIGGLIVIGLSVPRGKKTESYGSWDRFVR